MRTSDGPTAFSAAVTPGSKRTRNKKRSPLEKETNMDDSVCKRAVRAEQIRYSTEY